MPSPTNGGIAERPRAPPGRASPRASARTSARRIHSHSPRMPSGSRPVCTATDQEDDEHGLDGQDEPESPSHADDLSDLGGLAPRGCVGLKRDRSVATPGLPWCSDRGSSCAGIVDAPAPARSPATASQPARGSLPNRPTPRPGDPCRCTSATRLPLRSRPTPTGRLVEGADAIPVVRLHRRLAGLAVRHDGPAALQPGPQAGDHGACCTSSPATPRNGRGRRVRRLCHDRSS